MLKLNKCGDWRLMQRWSRLRRQLWSKTPLMQVAVNEVTCHDPEYTEVPVYPEIQDLAYKARKSRQVIDWHETIRKVPTVEEKLIKVNMPRYYGYKVVQLGDQKLPYNCFPAMQHYTRTAFEKLELADSKLADNQQDALVSALKSELEAVIEYVHDYFCHEYPDSVAMEAHQREQIFAQLIVEQVNRSLINLLAAEFVHLQEVEVDYCPRHEAFWSVGGINPPKNVVKSKKGCSWLKEMANDLYDRFMQFTGQPYLTVRHRHQLPTWKSENETKNLALAKELPRYEYDPRTLGYACGNQHVTNIPGYWAGTANNFGFISYQSRTWMLNRPLSYGSDEFKDALHAQAIQSSFAWLLAQANYNGFNTFNDLTYPMNTQTILTDGQNWSFYEYQLNTLLMHSRHIDENACVNFCRGTDELRLYEKISDTGKCIGLNEEVLRWLLRFYCNKPSVQRAITELQPYLSEDAKYIADYKNVDQREFLEGTYKNLVSKRPRHLEIPEIYMWEKLYKIDNKTRQMEPKRRYFELGINPWKRTLDQHAKEYIPKALRPEGPKSRKKWKPTYYP